MRCSRCGAEIPPGRDRCPHCGASVQYGGNTEFFGKAASSNLKFWDIFSDVFRRHSRAEGERLFMAGTSATTPPESEMLRQWTKPWVFAWVAILGVALALALYLMSDYIKSYAGFMLLGPFVVPLAALMFYWEMNIPRNIPLYEVLVMFLAGGVISLFLSMLLFQVVPMETASYAAFCEEPGKLLALAFFLRTPKKRYILNGVLVGGAVGAGFSAIESAGYALEALASDGTAWTSVTLRGILAPGGHVVWAAIEGAALAMVKGSEPLRLQHLVHPNFLMFFASSIVLHFIWNAAFFIAPVPVFGDVKYILLTVIAWAVLFYLMNQGVRQVVAAVRQGGGAPAASQGRRPAARSLYLVCERGAMAGQQYPLANGLLVLGRDPGTCQLILPGACQGVSRVHCQLEIRGGVCVLSDRGSTYGTYLEGGHRLAPGERVTLAAGQVFFLGSPENMFRLTVL